MRVLDFRLRPPYRSYLNSFMYDMPALEKSHQARDLGPVSAAARERSTDLLIREMDEAGVVLGVAPVRVPCAGDNEDALTLMECFPGRFLGIPWIDPLQTEQAVADIGRYCERGPCRGVIAEPGLNTTPVKWRPDDERLFPVYEACVRARIPLLLSFGGRMAHPSWYDPGSIHTAARRFPSLTLVLCHGGWPFVVESCQVAMDCPNVILSPDTWMMDFAPGAADYLLAANYTLRDQIVFGSSYPAMPLPLAVENYVRRLRPQVAARILYDNGARVFGL